MMLRRNLTMAVLLAALVAMTPQATAVETLGALAAGKPEIKSIHSIGFAPDGVLLIGDGAGSQVFAIATGDTESKGGLQKAIEGIDAQLAGRLGTTAKGIEILDLAVNPASGTTYVALRKQDDKSYVVLTIDAEGKIGEFQLDQVKYARVKLAAGKVRISRITDLAWAEDRIVAAGRGSETFTSSIFSIDAPIAHDSVGKVYRAETYHVAHGRWETKAPMSVVLPFKQDGKTYVVGAFSCTPIVKYPIDALEPGAQVKGVSVIELGSGNKPLDMFVYEKDGKPYVLANTFRFHHKRKPFGPSPYWTVKFEQGLLAENEAVNKQAIRRLKGNYEPATPKIQVVESFHGVMQMDKLDAKRALVLREGDKGLNLEPVPLP